MNLYQKEVGFWFSAHIERMKRKYIRGILKTSEHKEDDSVIKAQTSTGTVVSLWWYPIKSMLGEKLNFSSVTERGLIGIVPMH